MALGRVKTWIVETLTASDLNAEFNNILNNALSLISPLTGTLDANGNEIVLDTDGDTSITADTDDRVDFKLSGADLFQLDGTTTTPVNGISFVASATGAAPYLIALGTDTNIDLQLRPKGTGRTVLTDDSGNEILVTADVASAVNEITASNAVTTAPPFVQATGDDTNIDLELRSKGTGDVVLADDSGNEILIADDVASAVNEVTVTNAVTTAAPSVSATGDDTNIDLNLVTKGTGVLQLNGVNQASWVLLGTDTASASATIDFTWTGTYRKIVLLISAAIPATDATQGQLQTSTDAGSSWDSGASDYSYNREFGLFSTPGTTSHSADNAHSAITLTGAVGNDTNEQFTTTIEILYPSEAVWTLITHNGFIGTNGGTFGPQRGHGLRLSAADVDGVRFSFTAGNITSGEFALYGLA